MINYAETNVGEVLRITGKGAPKYANLGDVVTVMVVDENSVIVENCWGLRAGFYDDCGAERLEYAQPQKLEVIK